MYLMPGGGYAPAILSVLYGRDGDTDVPVISPVRSFRDIRIEGNLFSEYGKPVIEFSNAQQVQIRNNQVFNSDETYRWRDSYASIMLKNCADVAIDSLWVRDSDAKHYAAVDIDPDCSPGNTISIRNLQLEAHSSSVKVMDHRQPPYNYEDAVQWRVSELSFQSDLSYADAVSYTHLTLPTN